jgi:TonB family protein
MPTKNVPPAFPQWLAPVFALTTLVGCVSLARQNPEGSLRKEEIENAIRANVNEIKNCYEAFLQQDRLLKGKVIVEFVISDQGEVRTSRIVGSELNNRGVENCIMGEVTRWKFPLPRGGGTVIVKYPFLFNPN